MSYNEYKKTRRPRRVRCLYDKVFFHLLAISIIFTRDVIRFIVNDPNEHTGHEGKFYRHPDIEHRTLCQLSSSHGPRIYS